MASWHKDFRIGDWQVSPKLNSVCRNGQTVSVKLKSMAVLTCLADADGEVLSRNDIMDTVWPGMTVTDDVLTQSIVELRKAFDDDAKNPGVIETIPRVGFRLVATVTPIDDISVALESSSRRIRPGWFAVPAAIVAGVALWFVVAWQLDERNPVIYVEERLSIAVLPFVNMSADPENDDLFARSGVCNSICKVHSRIGRGCFRRNEMLSRPGNADHGVSRNPAADRRLCI